MGKLKKLTFLSCGRFHSPMVAFRNTKTCRHGEIKQTTDHQWSKTFLTAVFTAGSAAICKVRRPKQSTQAGLLAYTWARVLGDFLHRLHMTLPCVVPVLWTVYTLVGVGCLYSSITLAMVWVGVLVQSRSQAKHPLWQVSLLSCHLACKNCLCH